jgi:hypothetical protein
LPARAVWCGCCKPQYWATKSYGEAPLSIHHQLIRNELGTWPDNQREEYEERAAILEFDAKLTRENAEIVAFQMMKKAMRK